MSRSDPPCPASSGEDAVVARIAAAMERASGRAPLGSVWIGDDAAVVPSPAGRLVLATDAAVGGVHADLTVVGLDDLGWKALTATVSDIAAVGARPCHALVTFCVPPGTDVDRLAAGVAEASTAWGCPVVGGDLTSAQEVVVNAAVAGTLDGPAPPVLRSGAAPGDQLVVTGPLGASAAGLRRLREGVRGTALVNAHLRPVARLAEGAAARSAGATAMMDVSDGLAIDVHRMADASRVGVVLSHVPVAPGATESEALSGGEDFELVIATPDVAALRAAFAAAGLAPPVAVGYVTEDPEERTLAGGPLAREGWQHRVD
jgi:thiamine-monophosphate kinase